MKIEVVKQVIVLIKTEVTLLEVVNRFGLAPKKKGKNFFVHCPFHGERTASLSIDSSKNLWKCFGCNEGGDQITFAQMMLGSGKRRFHETITWFVDNFNLTSPEYFAALSQPDSAANGAESQPKHYFQTRSPEEIQRDRMLESDLRAKITLLCDADYIENFDRAYQTILDYLDIEEEESEDLENRGCTIDWAYRNLYRSLPVNRAKRIEIAEEIAANLDFSEEESEFMPPGFFRIPGGKEKNKLCFGGDRYGLRLFQMDKTENGWRKSFAPKGTVLPIHGLLIPHRNREGKIISLKIRNQSFPEMRLADLLTWREEKTVPAAAAKTVGGASKGAAARPSDEDASAWRLNVPFRVNKLNAEKQELFYEYQRNWVPKYLFVSGNGQRSLTGVHFGNYERFREVYLRREASMHWVVTEGELKADIISERLGVPCLGLPGVTGNHFELFWEMNAFGHLDAQPEQVGEILDNALLDWDNWEAERESWLEYKRTHYRDKVNAAVERDMMSNINELSGKQIESLIEKEILLHMTAPADRELLFGYFKTPFNKRALTDMIFLALDEDDNISVNRALHRLGWMALKLGIVPLRIRWRKSEGKGFDDLLKSNGDWWVERLADSL